MARPIKDDPDFNGPVGSPLAVPLSDVPDVPEMPSIKQIEQGSPIVQLTFAQLEKLIETATAGGGPQRGEELRIAAAALTKLGDEVGRTVRRSNADHPQISAFSFPEGNRSKPKDTLKHETYFCGSREREDALTPSEIELYNRFDRSREARSGRWKATLEPNGGKMRLLVTVPAKTIDNLAELPPLTQILSELLYGSEVANPSQSMERLLAAERKIAELEARLAAA